MKPRRPQAHGPPRAGQRAAARRTRPSTGRSRRPCRPGIPAAAAGGAPRGSACPADRHRRRAGASTSRLRRPPPPRRTVARPPPPPPRGRPGNRGRLPSPRHRRFRAVPARPAAVRLPAAAGSRSAARSACGRWSRTAASSPGRLRYQARRDRLRTRRAASRAGTCRAARPSAPARSQRRPPPRAQPGRSLRPAARAATQGSPLRPWGRCRASRAV